jgi:hypothetical protein
MRMSAGKLTINAALGADLAAFVVIQTGRGNVLVQIIARFMGKIMQAIDQQDKNWRFMVARANRFEAVLKQIAEGTIPREMLEQWQGLSEEAWYEQRGEYLQNLAQDALKPEPVTV